MEPGAHFGSKGPKQTWGVSTGHIPELIKTGGVTREETEAFTVPKYSGIHGAALALEKVSSWIICLLSAHPGRVSSAVPDRLPLPLATMGQQVWASFGSWG